MMSDKLGRKPFWLVAIAGLCAVMLIVALGDNLNAYIIASIVRSVRTQCPLSERDECAEASPTTATR